MSLSSRKCSIYVTANVSLMGRTVKDLVRCPRPVVVITSEGDALCDKNKDKD